MSKFNKFDLEKLESYWKDLEKLKKQLRFREWELLNPYQEQDTNIGGSSSGNISDTTAQKATALIEDKLYNNIKDIIEAVESVYKMLDDDQKEIVKMRYWDNDGCCEWEDITYELGITRYKALNKRNKLIDMTAERLGWV